MDTLSEYHKITLLAANCIQAGKKRPANMINYTNITDSLLMKLFTPIDDGSLNIVTIAQTVGCGSSRNEEDAQVMVI